jgi:hypothetical protein
MIYQLSGALISEISPYFMEESTLIHRGIDQIYLLPKQPHQKSVRYGFTVLSMSALIMLRYSLSPVATSF